MANAAVIQSFGTRDLLTSEYLSNRMGGETVSILEKSATDGSGYGSQNVRNTSAKSRIERRQLLYPEQVARFPRDMGILFIENSQPISFQKIRYYSDPRFSDDSQPTEHYES